VRGLMEREGLLTAATFNNGRSLVEMTENQAETSEVAENPLVVSSATTTVENLSPVQEALLESQAEYARKTSETMVSYQDRLNEIKAIDRIESPYADRLTDEHRQSIINEKRGCTGGVRANSPDHRGRHRRAREEERAAHGQPHEGALRRQGRHCCRDAGRRR
jgi:hypothetical protein